MKSLVLALLLTSSALAQQGPLVFTGTWTATAGPNDVLRGSWSAQTLGSAPNAASGSWLLFDDSRRVVLQGTWSAEKLPSGWRGRWSARVQPSATTGGAAVGAASGFGSSLTGTWTAASLEDVATKTLTEMLQTTLRRQVAGSWQSGKLSGNWWVQATPH